MNNLESAVIGYIAGVILGTFLLLFAVGWFLVRTDSIGIPDWYSEAVSWVEEYHQANTTVFEVAFVIGFLSGLGGTSTAANNKRNKSKK